MHKICVVTGTRAEYGLLKQIIKQIRKSNDLELQLVATGMHLLPEFGNTVDNIRNDGFILDAEVPIMVGGNTKSSMATSIGIGVISLTQTFEILEPDIVLILGDRFEIFAAAIAASYSGRIVAHVHGGDRSEGGYDEYTRHSITKISHIHFPATNKSAERILKLGEEPERITIAGSPALETIMEQQLLSKKEICETYLLNPFKEYIIVVQHPLSTCPEKAAEEMEITLDSVINTNKQIIVIYPNNDPGGLQMIEVIKKYEVLHLDQIRSYQSIPFEHYLSLLKNSDLLIGNSSSGIIESPSFNIPVINIGMRQKGREKANNVIDVPHDRKSIEKAIHKAFNDPDFKNEVNACINPYGEGNTSRIICDVLANININRELLIKRTTYD
ncbi:UDP-N-acetylglucosamine 2-epimerase (hydrolyzing) [Methanococcoides sp. SA1]|nr:UDP-N-acetylglucosamine 2-epimerase (hydrolyzing) [Methanococcoides sp. SA1]